MTKSSKTLLFFAVLFFLVSLTACVTLFFGWQQFQKLTDEFSKTKSKFNTSLEKTQQFTVTEMLVLEQKISQIEKIAQRNSKSPVTSYFLLEAEYLTEQALLSLNFGRDVPAAITLLQAADQRIQSSRDVSLRKIRLALADKIAALQAVPAVDTEGLLARLHALQEQTKQLPLFAVPKAEPTATKSATLLTTEKDWRKALQDSWTALQKVVIIRHRDQPIVPLLPPYQESYLRQNLHLLLQQAQWAILHNQSNIYRTSLDQASQWVQHYFANNETSTQAMLAALTELKKINIRPELPDLIPLVKTVSQALKNKTQEEASAS